MVFENWIRVLIKPKQAFAEEKVNASLGKAVIIIFVAGIIAEIIADIPFFINFYHSEYEMFPLFLTLIVGTIVLTPIIFLISSGILYGFAKLLKGRGNFTTQTYLIALFSAPCLVIIEASKIIPFVWWFLRLLVVIYGLYLLTLALRETHQYSTGKAILTWLIPFIIVFVVGGAIFLIWFISTIPMNV